MDLGRPGPHGVDYHEGYADGMRETVLIMMAALLASVFLLVRYMDKG